MPSLTVFTPTYNRAHLIGRVYESLCRQTCMDFEWLVIDDGSTDNTREIIEGFIAEKRILIRYIWKENGGLYTGYNTAYANITTPLNVCIDSDDFMPDDAVEIILNAWKEHGGEQYAGLVGLDFYADTKQPIGGYFPKDLLEVYLYDLKIRHIHPEDVKQVMRTDLMKQVAPQVGFPGEKDFNPYYMLLQASAQLPLWVVNKNLCFVDYQPTGMAANIFKQYLRSPRSFMKFRLLEMQMSHNTWFNLVRANIHYVASCCIARERDWLKKSPLPWLTFVMSPFGVMLYLFILWRAHQKNKQYLTN